MSSKPFVNLIEYQRSKLHQAMKERSMTISEATSFLYDEWKTIFGNYPEAKEYLIKKATVPNRYNSKNSKLVIIIYIINI